jgi:hypothetical protein
MDKPTSKKPTMQNQSRQQAWTLPASWGWYTTLPGLVDLAESFAPINLEQMESVALLNRTDTKFVMSSKQLLKTLEVLQQDYWMLSIQDQRLNHYRTLYFDTPDFEFYRTHVNGQLDRYKVRSREYLDSNLSFVEVKHKTNRGRMIKNRLCTDQLVDRLTPGVENWLCGIYPQNSQALEPKLWNTFTRLTLVSKQRCERVTLDVDLTIYNDEKVVDLDGIAIAEVKMESAKQASSFLNEMHLQKINRQGFSKYCIGVSLLYDPVKKNQLKPKLMKIGKIIRGDE